jgi:hypothetical protein
MRNFLQHMHQYPLIVPLLMFITPNLECKSFSKPTEKHERLIDINMVRDYLNVTISINHEQSFFLLGPFVKTLHLVQYTSSKPFSNVYCIQHSKQIAFQSPSLNVKNVRT